MKKPRLLNLAAGVSLLLAIAAVVCSKLPTLNKWELRREQWRQTLTTDETRSLTLAIYADDVRLSSSGDWTLSRNGPSVFSFGTPEYVSRPSAAGTAWNLTRLQLWATDDNATHIGVKWSSANFVGGPWSIDISVYTIAAGFMTLAIIIALLARVAAGPLRRRGQCLCPTCGYDLRAHAAGDRCPECGRRIPAPYNAG